MPDDEKSLIEQGNELLKEDTDSMTPSQKAQWMARAQRVVVKMELFNFLEMRALINETER